MLMLLLLLLRMLLLLLSLVNVDVKTKGLSTHLIYHIHMCTRILYVLYRLARLSGYFI